MSFLAVMRSRTGSTLAVLVLIGAALLTVPALASAAPSPYPPTSPSSGVDPISVHRVVQSGNSTEQANETASTGFATFTATSIAVALLGGGIFLVVAGRRRRRTS